MALTTAQQIEIKRKAELGIPLVSATPEAVKMYNTVQEIKRKAEEGIPLVHPDPWSVNLYSTYAKSGYVPPTPSGGTGQGSNIGGGQNGQGGSSGGSPYYPNTPPLDQTPPVIGNPDIGGNPMIPIGSGMDNPVNKLELNSLVAVGIGFIFIRGAFKLLTKIF